MKTLSALLPLAFTITPLAAVHGAPRELNVHYQQYTGGHNYTASDFTSDWREPFGSGNFGNGDQRVVVFPEGSTYKRLRFHFDRNTFGKSHLLAESLLSPQRYYTFEYRVRFDDSWQFVKGGKLPGIGGNGGTGGGNPSTDAMSARVMWAYNSRWDGVQGGSSRNYFHLYHYWRGQALAYFGGDTSRKFGDSTYLSDAEKNRWYTFKMRLVRGSGSSDGRLRLWVNGVKKHDRDYRYLDPGDDWKFDTVMHHYFYGGNSLAWAPSQDTQLFFDNARIDNDWF